MLACPNIPKSMEANIDMCVGAVDFSLPVLMRQAQSYKKDVTGILYTINDDPENVQTVDISFTSKVEKLHSDMQVGANTDWATKDARTLLACDVYDYLWSLNDKCIMEQILKETKTNDNLYLLAAKLQCLRDCILKDIDRIA